MATQRAKMIEQSTTWIGPQACPPVETDHEDLWHTLIGWEELEHWRQDNQWIRGSYRRTANSYLRSFTSIFQIHNETVNIWSHMVPAILSLPVAYMLHSALRSRYDCASKSDVIAFGFFFAGSALCMGMSAVYVSHKGMPGQC